jgi:hypothetical protein
LLFPPAQKSKTTFKITATAKRTLAGLIFTSTFNQSRGGARRGLIKQSGAALVVNHDPAPPCATSQLEVKKLMKIYGELCRLE